MSGGAERESTADSAYTLRDYGMMAASPARLAVTLEALRATVRPGSVVVDLGSGFGLVALIACRLGAARVYAIESSPIGEVARQLAADNGCADRVISICNDATRVTLPERADVLVADLRGVLPFYDGSLATMIDARNRFVRPGGIVVPQRDRLWAAVVCAPDLHDKFTSPWRDTPLGLDLSRLRDLVVHEWAPAAVSERQIVSDASCWTEIEYATLDSASATGTAECVVRHDGPAHGVCVWFDTDLVAGVGFSNAPSAPPTVHGRAFFPWPSAIALHAGEVVRTKFRVLADGREYTWVWETSVSRRDGAVRAHWQQATFLGQAFATAAMHRRAHTHVPRLSEQGRITRAVLELMDGAAPLGDIATRLERQFPDAFADWHAALHRAAGVASETEEIGRDDG